MKPINQVKRYKLNPTQRQIYGQDAHYWTKGMLPIVSSAALINVVLENSEKAYEIYSEAVEAWDRKDCQSALSEVRITEDDIKACIKYLIEKKQNDI